MILATSRRVRVFAFPQPADLRKGYDGLYGLVANQLRCDVLTGDLFLFVNRRRDACKVLVWDGTGLCIFHSRAPDPCMERAGRTAGWACQPTRPRT